MLYISCLTVLFIMIFNYQLLLYVGICFIINMMINNCISDGYWLNSTDMCLRLFGNCVYLSNYILYVYRDSYIILTMKDMYIISYAYLYNINSMIDVAIKNKIFSYLLYKPKTEITNNSKSDIDIEVINILHSNLKLIIYVENLNQHQTDNELNLLLVESKTKINSYIKKKRKKPSNILEDIKKYNN